MSEGIASEIFTLLVVFQLKHFLADYLLQTRYMLGKFRPDWYFVPPLLAHASVHAFFTLAICWYWQAPPQLALVDCAAHFAMDRIKAGPRWLGRFNDKGAAPFWIALGFDQTVHHLTHYYIIYRIIVSA